MDNIDNLQFFSYQDQVEWNRLKDLLLYVRNIEDLDTNVLDLVNVLVDGFAKMLNENNKTTVFKGIRDLLEAIKNRHVSFKDQHYM